MHKSTHKSVAHKDKKLAITAIVLGVLFLSLLLVPYTWASYNSSMGNRWLDTGGFFMPGFIEASRLNMFGVFSALFRGGARYGWFFMTALFTIFLIITAVVLIVFSTLFLCGFKPCTKFNRWCKLLMLSASSLLLLTGLFAFRFSFTYSGNEWNLWRWYFGGRVRWYSPNFFGSFALMIIGVSAMAVVFWSIVAPFVKQKENARITKVEHEIGILDNME